MSQQNLPLNLSEMARLKEAGSLLELGIDEFFKMAKPAEPEQHRMRNGALSKLIDALTIITAIEKGRD